ncbi:MAG: GYDIA family GHMP kinase [Aquaticitalea sp.]
MNPEHKTFYSNGKLLLTGEYVVLDGALSLGIPTNLGQSLKVELIEEPKINWKSLDENGTVWFEAEFLIAEILSNSSKSGDEIWDRLTQILKEAKKINPQFLVGKNGFQIVSKMDFPKNWGLGTSSTLINNIANWADVNAFELLSKTFGGSGYDIACAQHDFPITYQLKSGAPEIKEVAFNPTFKNDLYFLYLNKKQNSRNGIAHYKSNKTDISKEISDINQITIELIYCSNLNDFQKLMDAHEHIISKIIKQQPIKELLFADFKGSIKSLGAWGGDFVLVASEENPSEYFKSKGFNTILSYEQLIK